MKFTEKFRHRCKDKAKKNSDEARAIQNLREIRVYANWDDPKPNVVFYFILNPDLGTAERASVDKALQPLISTIPKTGPDYTSESRVVLYSDISAAEYVASDALDLERVS